MKAIEINSLTKYYGKVLAIKDIYFSVSQGEIFGFIGPNGAGKSTTIRTLMNLIFPTTGSAKIFGMDIVKDTKKIKMKTGYLPAEANYYHKMTVDELLDYSARFYKLKDYGKRRKYLTDILELDIARKISDLSSGNKKKVAIVQSLLHKPDLLILDEPTNGLDPLVQSAFYEILRKDNADGMTIFFSSHILSEVQKICDKVAIIRKGKIIKVESIENLKKNLLKHISVSFQDLPPEKLELDGIVNYTKDKNIIHFMFEGNLNNLMEFLTKYSIDNVSIEDPNLDEIFMHFYKNGGGEHVD